MGNFINLKSYVEPETTLFQPEVDVILAVIDQVLASFDTYPDKGTFILDGQKMGEKAKCIVRFNLEGGYCRPLEDTSDEITANAINNVLSWPHKPAYAYQGETKFFGQFPSGIYTHGRQKVLVLNTTYGRFLMSYYANSGCNPFEEHDECTILLQALAETFARMGKEDKVLQWSVERVHAQATDLEKRTITLVQDLFQNCTLSAIREWEDWHEQANDSGELTLFFE